MCLRDYNTLQNTLNHSWSKLKPQILKPKTGHKQVSHNPKHAFPHSRLLIWWNQWFCFDRKPHFILQGALRALKKGGFFTFNLRSKHAEQYNESFKSMLQQLEAGGKIEVVAQVNLPHFKNFGDHTYTSDVFTIKKL